MRTLCLFRQQSTNCSRSDHEKVHLIMRRNRPRPGKALFRRSCWGLGQWRSNCFLTLRAAEFATRDEDSVYKWLLGVNRS